MHLGRYDHPEKSDVMHQEADASSAIFRHPTGVIAIASSNEIHKVEPDTSLLRNVLEKTAEDSDYVLFDCTPGIDSTVENIMEACNELLIITCPHRLQE